MNFSTIVRSKTVKVLSGEQQSHCLTGASMAFQELEYSESLDEQEVIRQIIAGDTELFRLLVLRHQEKLHSVVLRSVRNEALASDICQDVFLKAYLNLASFRLESSFSTWIIRIALNAVHSYFSSRTYKEKLRSEVLDPEHLAQPAEAKTDGFDESAVAKLHSLVPRLRPKLREVFIICGLEQKSYAEAAEILNVPIGTVRSRLHHARLTVRKMYFKVP